MSRSTLKFRRRAPIYALILAAAAVLWARIGTAAPLTQGSQMVTAGMPTGMSPDAKMNQYAVQVYYFINGKDPSGGLGMATVPVPNVAATAGLPMPTAAQVAAASAAKAMAIVDAINAAKLPGVMAAVDPNTVMGMYPTGMFEEVTSKFSGKKYMRPVMAMADFTTYTVSGVRQSVNMNDSLGASVFQSAVDAKGKPTNVNVTQEVSNATAAFKPNNGARGMIHGTDSGAGALAGLSTGLDGSGNQSVVGFGFIDETSAIPTFFTESFAPSSGMTDSDVFNSLADLFNSDFSSAGHTAHYDPSTDTLSIDQLLPPDDQVWSSNSDTGLFLQSNTVVPEPSSLALIALCAAAILSHRQRVRVA